MYYSNSLNKKNIECLLTQITEGTEYVVVTANKINTPIKLNDKNVLDIYYRKFEIRINISEKSIQYTKYKDLKSSGIAYQKTSANPTSKNEIYAFFVAEENIEKAIRYLLGI